MCTLGISFITQFLRAFIAGNQLLEYNICTAEDPGYILSLPPFGRGYIEMFSTALHIFTHVRITIYKVGKSHQFGPDNRAKFMKNLAIKDIESRSLTHFTINFCCLLALASGALAITLLQVKSCDDLLDTYKSFVIIFNYVLFPNIIVSIGFVMYFLRKKAILLTVLRELKSNLKF